MVKQWAKPSCADDRREEEGPYACTTSTPETTPGSPLHPFAGISAPLQLPEGPSGGSWGPVPTWQDQGGAQEGADTTGTRENARGIFLGRGLLGCIPRVARQIPPPAGGLPAPPGHPAGNRHRCGQIPGHHWADRRLGIRCRGGAGPPWARVGFLWVYASRGMLRFVKSTPLPPTIAHATTHHGGDLQGWSDPHGCRDHHHHHHHA